MTKSEAIEVFTNRIKEDFGVEYIRNHKDKAVLSASEIIDGTITVFVGFETDQNQWIEYAKAIIDIHTGEITNLEIQKA